MQLVMGKVESSNIDSFGYDRDNRLLAVQFKGTGLYLYHGVPAELASEMEAAKSIGSYFNQRIKSNYSFTKILFEPLKIEKTHAEVKAEQPKSTESVVSTVSTAPQVVDIPLEGSRG